MDGLLQRDDVLRLLFDGFDELALRVSYKRAVEHFSTLILAAQGEAKIVVTSRTQHFYSDKQITSALGEPSALGEQASSQRGYRLVRLQRFTHEQIRAFLERRIGDPEKTARRMQLLSEVKDLMGLAENPRMLGFIADIPEEKLLEAQARDKEITSASLYEMLLNQWLQHEFDRAHPRGGLPGLDLKQRWSAVTGLAMRLWQQVERSINILEMPADLTAAVKALAEHTINSEEVQHQIGSGTLLVRDEGNNFSFIHQSVMEWLVAKAAAQELRQGGVAKALGAQELSPLMVDFVWGLAGRQEAEQWAHQVLRTESSSTVQKNALLVLERLGVQAQVGLGLAGQDLSGRDFSGTAMRGADLSGAILIDAKLVGTDLTGATLTGVSLRRADLSKATLTRADLRGADLSGSRLMGSVVTSAHLSGAILRQAKLVGATFDPDALEGLDKQALFGAAMPDASQATPMLSSIFPCYRVAISPDGRLLASCQGLEIRLWDLETGSMVRILKGHEGYIWSVDFSPDGTTLASGSEDTTIRLWDVAKGYERRILQGHSEGVLSVGFSPDGAMLASGSEDATVRLWDAVKGSEQRILQGHYESALSVAFSPDGTTLASGSDDATVRVWDVAKGSERLILQGHAESVWSVALSPDGGILASGSNDGTVRLWDVAMDAERRELHRHSASVFSVAFSPDGAMLASGSADGTVRLWDVAKGAERRVLHRHSETLFSVAFSPDGAMLASGSDEGTVRLWDMARGSERRVLQGHSQLVRSIAFAFDGATLASGSADGTVRLWDVFSGECLAVLVSLGEGWVAFSPDGRYRYAGNLSGAFWHVIGLCRFEPGEFAPSLLVPDQEPLYQLRR